MSSVPAAPSLLQVRLDVTYHGHGEVLRGCDFEIRQGECFGLAGPSGSGKSTCALALLRLLDPQFTRVSGRIEFQGADLLSLSEKEMRRIRGRQISLIPQSPLESLNPALRVGAQMREAWQVHRPECARDWKAESLRALADVRLSHGEQMLEKFPRELSVGMAQRILIALALLHRPKLVIADEATSALDVITQAEILDLLRRLHREYGMSILFITHDLMAAAALCQRLGVLRQGSLIECGPVRDIFERPRHPYTQELVGALPRPSWMTPSLAAVEESVA